MMLSRDALGFAADARLPLACTVVAGLGTTVLAVGQAVLLALALAAVIDGDPARVLPLAVGSVGCALGRAAVQVLRDVAASWTAERVKQRVRGRLLTAVTGLGPGWLVTQDRGRVQASVGDGVEALRAYVGSYLPQVAVALLAPVVLVTGAIALDPATGVVVAVAAVAMPLAKPVWRRLLGDRSRAHWDAYQTLSARMLESLQGMATLKMLDATRSRRSDIADDASRLYRTTRRGLAAALGAYCAATLAVGLGTAVASGVAAVRTADGAMAPLAAIIVLIAVAECFRPLMDLETYWAAGFHGQAASTGIRQILDAQPMPRTTQPTTPPAAGPPAVGLHRVSFTYPGASRPALVDVDLEIRPAEVVALVGRSGAGKSTVAALLQRWVDPDHGTVAIDGVDLRTLDLAAHRRRVAVVSQDVHLFAGSVADNLRLARPDATDEDLRDALARAQADAVVRGLPDGLATPLGERGARLSGGERQRIAIARAILADAPLLLLDEATSSLDGRTEAAIGAALADLQQGRTTLVIAHRLSTVVDADRVIVLDAGRVVESGPPAALLAQGGAWARMVDAQVGGGR